MQKRSNPDPLHRYYRTGDFAAFPESYELYEYGQGLLNGFDEHITEEIQFGGEAAFVLAFDFDVEQLELGWEEQEERWEFMIQIFRRRSLLDRADDTDDDKYDGEDNNFGGD